MSEDFESVWHGRRERRRLPLRAAGLGLLLVALPLPARTLHLLVCTGQSNSLGTPSTTITNMTLPAVGTHPVEQSLQVPFFYDNTVDGTSAGDAALGDSGGQWITLGLQKGGYYAYSSNHFGPEIGAARQLWDAGYRDFALVKASRGGGGNSYWDKTNADHHMYDKIVATVSNAVLTLPPGYSDFQIVGLLYLQGESNNATEAAAADTRFAALLANLRADLPQATTMSAVLGQITGDSSGNRLTTTQKQSALAASRADIGFASSTGLALQNVDGLNLHYNADSLIKMGQRMAAELVLTGALADPPAPLPASLYAWYRGDTGLVANASGFVTSWQNQATTGTPAARHLDRISGTPQAVNFGTPGGLRTLLRCDGTDGVWGTSANFGTIATSRTFVAYCRLATTNNGFLFDGSANAPGLSRAQVRSRSWQVGLQASGGGSNADTNTFPATTNAWQAHTFTFERLAGATVVTHAIAGAGSYTYTNSLTAGIGGLILGQNVAAALGLAVDLAEFLVYDRTLTAAERQSVTDYLVAKWGAPAEIPPPACTAVQSNRTVPNFGLHAVLDAQVFAASSPLTVTNLTFTLDGTTGLVDVAAVKVFFTGTSATFRPLAMFGSVTGSFAGTLTVSGSQALSPGVNHFWIALEPRRTAKWGQRLDAALVSVGVTDGVRAPAVSAPPEFLTLGNACASTIIRNKGDDGVNTYRIPGVATSTQGTVVAVFDIRYDSSADLPANVDVGVLRSTDNGSTWGPMIKALDFDKNVAGSSGNGVGDPAILVDRQTGALWVAGLWSYGSHGYAGSGAGLATNQTGQYVLARSDDDGLTWSAPINITAQAKVNTNWGVCFQGPGNGIQLRDGTLLFPSQHTDPGGGNARAFFIYSTNHGASWLASPDANPAIPPQLNENQMVELNSGQILVSSRAPSGGGGKRVWSTYTRGTSLGDGTWSPLSYLNPDPVCQASFLRYSSTLDGAPRNRLLFANPASASSRVNMSVRLSEDEGQTWSVSRPIDARPAAYSDLTVLADGTVGLLYETGDASANDTLTFVRFDLDWLTQADLDSDGDGMSDYYEGINGLSNGVNDANRDKDGDGVSNLQEFKAGTMANDPLSVFRVKSATVVPAGLRLEWSSVPGNFYAVEGAPGPLGGWTPEPGAESLWSSGPLRSLILPLPTGPQRFFRVMTLTAR